VGRIQLVPVAREIIWQKAKGSGNRNKDKVLTKGAFL
jgi:hypothetical protein